MDLFIDEAHTALGIFPVFFPCMLPTPLCGIFGVMKCPMNQSKQISKKNIRTAKLKLSQSKPKLRLFEEMI